MTRDNNIVLTRAGLRVELARPGTYYQGTRFDWSGVFRRIDFQGRSYCDEWFDVPDPLRHDNVCGPTEEFFGTIGYEDAQPGESFLKLGVGLLRRDSAEAYDWFHLYEISDPGVRTLELTQTEAVFTHDIPGICRYVKRVELTGEDSFRISHNLTTKDALDLRQYCHNFFTFGLPLVGPERSVEFDAPFLGTWRADSVNAECNATGIRITKRMSAGQKCYMGGIRSEMPDGYGFTLKAGPSAVRVSCTRPLAPSVLWSNHRVFCMEPYVAINTEPSVPSEWAIEYKLI